MENHLYDSYLGKKTCPGLKEISRNTLRIKNNNPPGLQELQDGTDN